MGYRDSRVETIDDASRRNSHPLIATIVGSVFLILSLAGANGSIHRGDDTIAYALGSGIGAVVIVGGIAWLITLRHASDGWKAGSLITFFIVGVLVGLARLGNAQIQRQNDAHDVANQMQQIISTPEGSRPVIAEGTGPLSKMVAALLNDVAADGSAFDDEAKSAGLAQVVGFEGLSTTSPVLSNCNRVAALADRARYYKSRIPAYLDHARSVGQAAAERGEISQNDVEDFVRGARGNESLGRQWDLLAEASTEGGALCRQLAQRNWVRTGSMIRFKSDSDVRLANTHLNRIKQLQSELMQLRAKARADTQSQVNQMKVPT